MNGSSHARPSVPIQRRSRGERLRAFAVVTGLLASAGLVWQSTQAAFSDTTENVSNSFTAGTVVLDENDADNVLYNVSGLVPGATNSAAAVNTRCVDVEYDGTVASAVKLYINTFNEAEGGAGGAILDSELKLLIQMGGANDTCASDGGDGYAWTDISAASPGDYVEPTVKAKTTFANGYATGWSPSAANSVRTFLVTYTMDADATNDAQGDSLSFNFTWEAQNT